MVDTKHQGVKAKRLAEKKIVENKRQYSVFLLHDLMFFATKCRNNAAKNQTSLFEVKGSSLLLIKKKKKKGTDQETTFNNKGHGKLMIIVAMSTREGLQIPSADSSTPHCTFSQIKSRRREEELQHNITSKSWSSNKGGG